MSQYLLPGFMTLDVGCRTSQHWLRYWLLHIIQ